MARSQGRTDFICETLLTASSDARSSLEGMQTSGLIEGASAFVVDKNANYILRPSSTATPDGDKVIAATGGGNWVQSQAGGGAGTDPVEVRSLADLPDPVAGVITLLADTRYEFIGSVDIGTNRITLSDGTHIVGRAGVIVKSGGIGAPMFATPATGEVTVERVTIDNQTASDVFSVQAGDVDLLLKDVAITNTATGGGTAINVGNTTPVTGGTIRLVNCSVEVYSSAFIISGGALDALEAIGCTFASSVNNGFIFSTPGTLGRVFVTGHTHEINGTSKGFNGGSGWTINSAVAVGNDFSGTGDTWAQTAAPLFSPIEVRSRTDLENATGAADLVDDTTYIFIGTIDLGSAGHIRPGANSVIEGRGATIRTNNVIFQIDAAASGHVRISDITCESTNGSSCVTINNTTADVTLTRCAFKDTNNNGCVWTGSTVGDKLKMLDCQCVPTTAAGSWGAILAGWEEAIISGCTFENSNSVDLGVLTNIALVGNILDVPAGRTGLTDASVTAGSIVGNIFTGAGTLVGAGVVTPKWVARGNIGVADF